jgi:hypothetical protein
MSMRVCWIIAEHEGEEGHMSGPNGRNDQGGVPLTPGQERWVDEFIENILPNMPDEVRAQIPTDRAG